MKKNKFILPVLLIIIFSTITYADYNYATVEQFGISSEAEIYQNGNRNTACTVQGTNDLYVLGNYAYAEQIGVGNSIYQTQLGNNNYAEAYQDGSNNKVYQTFDCNDSTAIARQEGNNNVIYQYLNVDSISVINKQIGNMNEIYRYNNNYFDSSRLIITQIGNGMKIILN